MESLRRIAPVPAWAHAIHETLSAEAASRATRRQREAFLRDGLRADPTRRPDCPLYRRESCGTLAAHQHYGRDVTLSECTDALLSDHIGWLIEEGLKPATINTGHLAVIKAILKEAHLRGAIDKLPTVRKLPVDLNEPDAWSPEQVALFIEATPAASNRPIAGLDAGDWWEALARVIWYSGIRRPPCSQSVASRRTSTWGRAGSACPDPQ